MMTGWLCNWPDLVRTRSQIHCEYQNRWIWTKCVSENKVGNEKLLDKLLKGVNILT